ncbi:alpha/beta hydrolase [Streptomyces sp. NPDC059506]|uniref:alpha/beta hydrolase n=1 Tax=Streptomyces sp. NPDC059506 TaxID=3347751 RepID=UPI003688AA8A
MPRTPAEEEASAFAHPPAAPDATVRYGDHPDQVVDLWAPGGRAVPAPAPLVVLVHGGAWREPYDRLHVSPVAAFLAGRGLAVASVEYRRTDGADTKGGWPHTLDDVAAAVDALPGLVEKALPGGGATPPPPPHYFHADSSAISCRPLGEPRCVALPRSPRPPRGNPGALPLAGFPPSPCRCAHEAHLHPSNRLGGQLLLQSAQLLDCGGDRIPLPSPSRLLQLLESRRQLRPSDGPGLLHGRTLPRSYHRRPHPQQHQACRGARLRLRHRGRQLHRRLPHLDRQCRRLQRCHGHRRHRHRGPRPQCPRLRRR